MVVQRLLTKASADNYFGGEYNTLDGTEVLPLGPFKLRYEFTYDGGGIGKGG